MACIGLLVQLLIRTVVLSELLSSQLSWFGWPTECLLWALKPGRQALQLALGEMIWDGKLMGDRCCNWVDTKWMQCTRCCILCCTHMRWARSQPRVGQHRMRVLVCWRVILFSVNSSNLPLQADKGEVREVLTLEPWIWSGLFISLHTQCSMFMHVEWGM
jgi:hypothetical protein